MTIREDITQAIRDWFKTAVTLTDAQIIPADDKGPRPPLPYLTVKVTTADVSVGVDEQIAGTSGGNPSVTPRGIRSGTVSVQGFGALTSEWLQDGTMALGGPAVRTILNAAGLTVTTLGAGVTDLSAFLDTRFEPRFLKEFQIGYALVGAEEVLTEATTVEMNLTLESFPNDPNPLVVDLTVLEP